MSRTADPGRAVVPIGAAQAEQPGAESLIEWPAPPFHEAVGESAPVFEGAMVACRDGRKLTGRLMRFSPATGIVEFCPEQTAIAQVLALSDILELRLVRAIRVRPRKSALNGRSGEGAVPTAALPFRLELAGSPALEGETYGFQVHSIGLFLFIRGLNLPPKPPFAPKSRESFGNTARNSSTNSNWKRLISVATRRRSV